MARSRKKVAKGAVEAGYATSDETFDKPKRKVQRKKFRKSVKSTLNEWVSNPNDSFVGGVDELAKERPSHPRPSCPVCYERCQKMVHELSYHEEWMKPKEKNEMERYEKGKNKAVFRTYRKIMYK